MSDGYWGDEVYSVPPLGGVDRTDAPATFDWLAITFPSDGGKIDWRSVESGHTHRMFGDEQLLTAVSQEIADRARPGTTVEHVGDSLSPFGLRFTWEGTSSLVIAALLEIPEHHYFLADDRSWLVVVSTEGDLDVVDRPSAGRQVTGGL